MGNYCCVIHGSSSTVEVWADEDCDESMEREELLVGHGESSSSTVGTTGNQVRIRISKKELEAVLDRVDRSGTRMKKMKAHQVIQKLIDKSEHFEIHDQRTWSPALHSISEVN